MLPETLQHCVAWYASAGGLPTPDPSWYCPTRDVLEGRLASFLTYAGNVGLGEPEAALLTAVAGEVGNNSFDHNLGHWRDQPGCCFACAVDAATLLVWIADRGRGVLESLRRVVPGLGDHQQALETAFERNISGRQPERRGNGLKFVRSVINEHSDRGLVSVSGRAMLAFGGLGSALRDADHWPHEQDYGMLTVVAWTLG